MFAKIAAVAIFATAALALPQAPSTDAASKTLKTCSWSVAPPCSCPSGTYFNESTTVATIGANAKDVQSVMGSFFNTAWFGVSPTSTTGKDDTTGATRTLPDGSVGNIIEEVHSYTMASNGSFDMQFNLKNGPPGFYGDWDTLKTTAKSEYETAIYWNIYSCFEIYNNNKAFHESAIKNATSILQKEGKIKGTNVAPTSTGD